LYHKARPLLVPLILISLVLWTVDAKAESIFRITLGFDTRYDTNAGNEAEGEESRDMVSTLNPGAELTNTGKRYNLLLRYSMNARFFTNNPDFNDQTHSASADLKARLSDSTNFNIGDKVTYSPDAVEIDELTRLNIQVSRTDILYNNFSTGLSHSFGKKTSASIAYSNSILSFKDPAFTDTRTDSLSVGLTRAISSKLSSTLSYGYTIQNFDNNATTIDIHSAELGLSYTPTRTISLNVSGGGVYTPETGDEYDWIARADIVKAFQASSLTAGYSRGVTHSAGLSNELNVNNVFTIGYSATLSKVWNMNLTGAYSKNTSKPSRTLDNEAYTVGLGAGYRYAEWLTFRFGYSHFQQWARGTSGNDLARDMIFVGVQAVPYEMKF